MCNKTIFKRQKQHEKDVDETALDGEVRAYEMSLKMNFEHTKWERATLEVDGEG